MTKKDSKIPEIYIILGPTSLGKTSLALKLCEKFNGEIISADSRQICKYMDIGTGKVPLDTQIRIKKGPNYWELNEKKIWGYDLINPDQYFSGYDFAIFALEKAREIIENGKNVFLVGGTGFYIDIFTGRIKLTQVSPDLKLRKSLESLSLDVLQNKLREIDNEMFESVDKLNKVRLVRALEKKLSANKDNDKKRLPYFDFYSVYIGLTSSRNVIYERVDKWVEKIWDSGLLNEVMNLREKGYGETHRVKGLIYGTAGEFLDGKLTRKGAIERTKYDVHSYVRRQQTWFKRNPDIEWFDISQDDFEEIIYNRVKENIKNG